MLCNNNLPFASTFLTLKLRLTTENKLPEEKKEKIIETKLCMANEGTYGHRRVAFRDEHHRRVELLLLDNCICDYAGGEHRRHQKYQN